MVIVLTKNYKEFVEIIREYKFQLSIIDIDSLNRHHLVELNFFDTQFGCKNLYFRL